MHPDTNGELILYRSPDGVSEILLRASEGTVWLTQAEIAELFETTKQNVVSTCEIYSRWGNSPRYQ